MHSQLSFRFATTLCLCVYAASTSHAHFLWLMSVKVAGQDKAVLYFSESAHQQKYHLPKAMANTHIWPKTAGKQIVELNSIEQVDTDTRTGLAAKIDKADNSILATTCDYGIYGGSLLSYYTKHIRCSKADDLGASGRNRQLQLEIVPNVIEGRIELTVYWQGKPKAEVEVAVAESNEETQELKTDAQGQAYFRPTTEGLVGVRAGFTDRAAKGEHDGTKYEGAAHYATLTFELSSIDAFNQSIHTVEDKLSAKKTTRDFPLLPAGIASFGAAVHNGWLFVYGGHIGDAHDHSSGNLSPHFHRLQLDGGEAWEALPMQTPLQGLALVAHKSGLYRIGGMHARNAKNEDEDLHSTAEFAHFDPETRKWSKLPNLPDARSSHDAVVVGDMLYVAGGWTLQGDSDGEWVDTVIAFDLSKPDGQWKTLSKAPFQRRALAVSHWRGKLIVLGGLDDEGDISFETNFFDLESQEWKTGPKLPGQGMDGFGVSAWNLSGKLYASGLEGRINRLNVNGDRWQEVASLNTPRFFHQLLPSGNASLVAVAGASRNGHLAEIEKLTVKQ